MASDDEADNNLPHGDMPGRLVDIGDSQLYLYCAGEGGPTVVLEAGLGDTHETWAAVQASVAAFTRVCSYDRAGLGRSAPGAPPRMASHMVEELHTLLRSAGVPGPVCVGWALLWRPGRATLCQSLCGRDGGDGTGGTQRTKSRRPGSAAELSSEEMAEQMRFQNGENDEGADLTTSFAEVRAARWQLQAPLVVLVRGTIPPDEEPPNWTPEGARPA